MDGMSAIVRMATEFGSGCVLYTLTPKLPAWLGCRGDLVVGGAVAGLILVLLDGWPLAALPLLILLVYGSSLPQSPVGRFLLCARVPLFLGRISFALYITHKLVIYTVDISLGRPQPLLAKVACTSLVLAAALLLATFLCITVEEPVRRWGRNRTRTKAISGMVSESPGA